MSTLFKKDPALRDGLLWALLLFFGAAWMGSYDTHLLKLGALAGCALAGVPLVNAAARARLRGRFSPETAALCGYMLLAGASCFYAVAPKFALKEFCKLLFAFGVYMLALSGKWSARTLIKGGVFAGAGLALLSLDLASVNWLGRGFLALMGLFTDMYTIQEFFRDSRVMGLFGNGNTLASILGVCMALGLYLVLESEDKRERCVALCAVQVSALAFLTAFSLGGTFSFVVACLVFLVFTKKGARWEAFFLMLECALFAFAALLLCYRSFGPAALWPAWLPVAVLPVGAAGLCGCDLSLRASAVRFCAEKPRAAQALLLGLLALLVAFAAAAVLWTGPVTLHETPIKRIVFPAPGTYTAVYQGEDGALIDVCAQTEGEFLLDQRHSLAQGVTPAPLSFRVEQTDVKLDVYLSAASGATLQSLAFQGEDGALVQVPLGYKLLPELIAYRLQGVQKNTSFVTRQLFAQWALRLFALSPVLGRGLGGTENGLMTVQDFYFETAHVHNHFYQVLADLGALGLALYVAVLGLSAWALISRWRAHEPSPLLPALAGALTMVAVHGANEISMSTGEFLPFAFLAFALIPLALPRPLCPPDSQAPATAAKGRGKAAVKGRAAAGDPLTGALSAGVAVFCAVFALLILMNLYAGTLLSRPDADFDDVKTAVFLDRFEYNDYKLAYINASLQYTNPVVTKQAAEYAKQLQQVSSNTIKGYLAQYYFSVGEDATAFVMARGAADYCRTKAEYWQAQFEIIQNFIDPGYGPMDVTRWHKNRELYIRETLALYDHMLEYNETTITPIALTYKNECFIESVRRIAALEDPSDAQIEAAFLEGFEKYLDYEMTRA